MEVDQAGFYIKVRPDAGSVRWGDGRADEFVDSLPYHPADTHVKQNGERTFVLPGIVGREVLVDLSLPPDPDPNTVYIGTARVQGCTAPFVRVVWYTPQTADCVTGRGMTSHYRATEALYEKWLAVGECHTQSSHTTQPAGGVYTELGVGLLAGTGRTTLHIGGKGTHVPYPRNPTISEYMEPALSSFMSDVSEVLHTTLPSGVLHEHEDELGWPCEATKAYQYPQLREGTPPLRSHQVVIRGPSRGGASSMRDRDRVAYMSASDMHVDPWDGGGSTGTCTVHTCHNHTDVSHPVDTQLLRHRGLAVFPSKGGGRGVHIISMRPGWHCAILMNTDQRLHGSVLPEEEEIGGYAFPSLKMMRVVTYPLKGVERLLARLAQDPDALQELYVNSKPWIQHRMSVQAK